MTPDQRAEFLGWLNSQSIESLREVASHVNGVITHKRGMKLRALAPGSPVVVEGKRGREIGTVVRLHKVSVLVEFSDGRRENFGPDSILGLHIGRGEFSPLDQPSPGQPVQWLGGEPQEFVGPSISELLDEARGVEPLVEAPYCQWCGEPGSDEAPLVAGPGGSVMHAPCIEAEGSVDVSRG